MTLAPKTTPSSSGFSIIAARDIVKDYVHSEFDDEAILPFWRMLNLLCASDIHLPLHVERELRADGVRHYFDNKVGLHERTAGKAAFYGREKLLHYIENHPRESLQAFASEILEHVGADSQSRDHITVEALYDILFDSGIKARDDFSFGGNAGAMAYKLAMVGGDSLRGFMSKCVCCFPAPSGKARKLEYRRAKQVSAREARRLITESV